MAATNGDSQVTNEVSGRPAKGSRLAQLREKLRRPRRPATAEVTPSPKDLGKEHRGY